MVCSRTFEKFSDWNRLIIGLATIRKSIQLHLSRKSSKEFKVMDKVELLRSTEYQILKVQSETFKDKIDSLKNSKQLSKQSSIYNLDPIMDEYGLLRVGGRLSNLDSDTAFKAPIILSGKHHVSLLIVRKYHQDTQHQGRNLAEGRIRSAGFWIVGGKRLVSSLIYKCVTCRKLRKPPQLKRCQTYLLIV